MEAPRRLARKRVDFRAGFVVSTALFAAVLLLIPVVWMVLASIEPIAHVLAYPPRIIPSEFTLAFFTRIIGRPEYQRFFVNSVVVSVVTVVATVTLGLLGGYGFSRFNVFGSKVIFMSIMGLWLLPPVSVIIPYFVLARTAHVFDSVIALILVNTAFTLPINIWLLKGYLDAVPRELDEAALMDGCNRLQALQKVLLPLALPGLIGTATFAFVAAWNEYLFAIILTDSPRSQTLPIGLAAFFGQFARDWNSIMALASISALPLVVIFVVCQRWVVQGLTSGAVK